MPGYNEQALKKASEYRESSSQLILGIESSCDETAAAVLRGREVLGTAVHTQIPVHRLYGGVVPEIASRSHTERIGSVVREALDNAGVTLDDISAVAVTYRPGLIGALLVGVSYAKGLAYAKGLPLVGVDHITGHIAANYITYPDLEPPFMCIVASGGHSHIVRVDSYTDFTLIGRTRDDAAGEAFDKVARAMGLPYPGGPELEKLALGGDPGAYPLRTAFNEGESYDFSFSGLKTAVVNILHNAEQKGESVNKADLAASFQRAVTDALAVKSVRAARESGLTTLALAGGVSANTCLRERLQRECDRYGIRFCRPDMKYCTDNAAMVACQGHYEIMARKPDELSLDPNAASFLQAQQ
ncbi:MAG: tRNA (adenosine(37)-N6)-threonylcarbamoyltransferase complex transferase subunit TsaD [Clostridia bacterium]|nr:tRNA (adenosine(37)-N6)-threonylcarbamoyltransferase complex transferase subunit TsaD [Clostridia bacterium]